MAAVSDFPNSVWNGLTSDRRYITDYRDVNQTDWDRLVAEIRAVQQYLIDNPPSSAPSGGGSFLLGGLSPNP